MKKLILLLVLSCCQMAVAQDSTKTSAPAVKNWSMGLLLVPQVTFQKGEAPVRTTPLFGTLSYSVKKSSFGVMVNPITPKNSSLFASYAVGKSFEAYLIAGKSYQALGMGRNIPKGQLFMELARDGSVSIGVVVPFTVGL